MDSNDTPPASPTVKTTPDYKVGQKVMHTGTQTERTIEKIFPKAVRLSGVANRVSLDAISPL